MEKEQVVQDIAKKMKLIRTEQSLSQDRMAEILGISKKTLVQIEKERTLPGWNVVVSFTALFENSEILQNTLGNEPLEVIRLVTFGKPEEPYGKTMGGKVWWREIDSQNGYTLQQNLISQHYRIIDQQHFRWYSTFDQNEALERFKQLIQ
ncbi:helix-turn-helix domain-containing protein [Jeotgalibacillus sp. R-1-5s-1]|uniref:helix-turn-helix domain-containing protein n=1 Tax=Jeotgalibacillus sp. R-1-5s-1 TaxID=2555897 RepID=UPI001ABD4009|nr:helix-turn-helix domain-containing protein [Jeotgalibacillus sp. R-1-5s-1]